MPSFERFVAIDWSGARGPRYSGIAVAECRPGRAAPILLPPPDARGWTRRAVADWLLSEVLTDAGAMLVGFDFAFTLPFAKAGCHLPRADATVFDLWALVDAVCADAPDFLGSPFVEHPVFADDFWTKGPKPAAYVEAQRPAEAACAAEGLGTPQSPYKLIGAKQVGRGTLAGMRVLHRLRTVGQGRFGFWPFEALRPGQTVCVEIYPRLFLKRTGFGTRKIRDTGDLSHCLETLGCDSGFLVPDAPTDHDTDALVSAAGLRLLATEPAAWSPAGLTDANRRDGWIFGVGANVGNQGAFRPRTGGMSTRF